MKYAFLLALLFLLASFRVSAQTTDTTTAARPAAGLASSAPVLSQGRQDTITAINQLFERRRKGGRNWIYVALGGGLGVGRVLVAADNANTSTSKSINQSYGTTTTAQPIPGGTIATLFGIFTGIPAAVGIIKLAGFSTARQEAIISAYKQGQPLPAGIRRRL